MLRKVVFLSLLLGMGFARTSSAGLLSTSTTDHCGCVKVPVITVEEFKPDPNIPEKPDEVEAEEKRLDDLWEPPYDPDWKPPVQQYTWLCLTPNFIPKVPTIPNSEIPPVLGPDWRPYPNPCVGLVCNPQVPVNVPEPLSLMMFGLGAIVAGNRMRKR